MNQVVVLEQIDVRHERVVHISRAEVNNSRISGTFRLSGDRGVWLYGGYRKIAVDCRLKGKRSAKGALRMTLFCIPHFEDNYSGPVVSQIAEIGLAHAPAVPEKGRHR
jgi:hypothetical protein